MIISEELKCVNTSKTFSMEFKENIINTFFYFNIHPFKNVYTFPRELNTQKNSNMMFHFFESSSKTHVS